MPPSGDGSVIGFDADPLDGVMLDDRLLIGDGIGGMDGALGAGNGILPEGGFGISGKAGNGDGEYARGIFQLGCLIGNCNCPDIGETAGGGAGGAGGGGGAGAGSTGSLIEVSSTDIGSGSGGNHVEISASPSSAGCHGIEEMSISPGKTSSVALDVSWDCSSIKPKYNRYDVVFHCSRDIRFCGSTG